MPPRLPTTLAALLAALLAVRPLGAQEIRIPVLVPLTGFLALEGASQRNGALLAMSEAPGGLRVDREVLDTGVSPEGAADALTRILDERPLAAVAPILGTQMLAMLPIAREAGLPLLTVSGTARITELGNPWIFRFYPGDNVVKVAQARYLVEVAGRRHPAILYQTDAYGQSGRDALTRALAALQIRPVLSEGVDVAVKDFLPVLSRLRAAGADAILPHLHVASTALLIRQAAALGLALPIVSGSAAATPAAAALLAPGELKGVCAESAAAPLAPATPAGKRFLADYRAAFKTDPDTYALAQYDGTMMALAAAAAGARTPEALRAALAAGTYDGVAMHYRSDGAGNMAHSAVILCYDGTSRVPALARRYEAIEALK